MAFLAYDPSLDPDKKQQDQNGMNVSGASTSFDSSQPPGSQTGKPKSSGQFTNIQGYLNANKEQASTMGNNLVTNVQQNANQAQNDIQKFGAEKQSVAAVDPNKYLANPVSSQKNEYQALKNTGGYTGPNDLSQTQHYQAAQGSSSKANDLVKASGTEEGRMTLLQEAYKRPNYSRGMQKLDQALLQNDAGSKQQFADLNQKYSGISSMFDNTANEVGNSINQAKTTAAANKGAIAQAEQQTIKSLMDPIQKRADEMNSNNAGFISRVTADAKDDILNDETLAALGLSEGQQLYDLNLENYVTPDQSVAGLNNAANSEERSRYSALAELIGDPSMNQISADGKGIKPITFDQENFSKDLDKKQKEYEAARSTSKGQIFATGADGTQVFPWSAKEMEESIIPAQQAKIANMIPSPAKDIQTQFLKTYMDSLNSWKAKYATGRKIAKG